MRVIAKAMVRKTEAARGFGLIPAGRLQRLRNQPPLIRLHAFVKRRLIPRGLVVRQRQIVRRDIAGAIAICVRWATA